MKKIMSLVLSVVTITSLVGVSFQSVVSAATKSPAKPKPVVKKVVKAQKAIAGTVAISEILYKLDIDMVGVPTTEYPLPKKLTTLKKIGNPMTPDLEVVKSLSPAKIVSVNSLAPELKKSFEQNKIDAKFVNLDNLEGLKKGIIDIGNTFGKQKKAKEVVEDINKREKIVLNKVKGKKSPKVMIIFGAPGSFMIATDKSFVGDLAKKVGATNVISNAKSPFIPVNMEMLASQQPDFILRMTHAKPAVAKQMFDKEFSQNNAWQSFKAVKNNKVYDLENGYFGMSANLKSVEALEKLGKILYK